MDTEWQLQNGGAPLCLCRQRLCRQRLCIVKLAQAPQALVIVGACTARGQAQAPRARRLIGCKHLFYILTMVQAPQALVVIGVAPRVAGRRHRRHVK